VKRTAYIVLAAIVLLGLLPLLGVLAASWFAQANGCRLTEANPYPCLVNGRDWGGVLYSLALGVWLALATVPISLLAGLALAIMALRDLINKRRAGKP
jgi:ABC-type Fe3+ transport system permease subunit